MVHYASQENNIPSQNESHRKNIQFSLTKSQEEGKSAGWMVNIKIFATTVNFLYWMSKAKSKIWEIKRILTVKNKLNDRFL